MQKWRLLQHEKQDTEIIEVSSGGSNTGGHGPHKETNI